MNPRPPKQQVKLKHCSSHWLNAQEFREFYQPLSQMRKGQICKGKCLNWWSAWGKLQSHSVEVKSQSLLPTKYWYVHRSLWVRAKTIPYYSQMTVSPTQSAMPYLKHLLSQEPVRPNWQGKARFLKHTARYIQSRLQKHAMKQTALECTN